MTSKKQTFHYEALGFRILVVNILSNFTVKWFLWVSHIEVQCVIVWMAICCLNPLTKFGCPCLYLNLTIVLVFANLWSAVAKWQEYGIWLLSRRSLLWSSVPETIMVCCHLFFQQRSVDLFHYFSEFNSKCHEAHSTAVFWWWHSAPQDSQSCWSRGSIRIWIRQRTW
jgi:hypothetical protein